MVPVMDEVLTSVSAEEASAEGVSADSETCVETVSSAEETGWEEGWAPHPVAKIRETAAAANKFLFFIINLHKYMQYIFQYICLDGRRGEKVAERKLFFIVHFKQKSENVMWGGKMEKTI